MKNIKIGDRVVITTRRRKGLAGTVLRVGRDKKRGSATTAQVRWDDGELFWIGEDDCEPADTAATPQGSTLSGARIALAGKLGFLTQAKARHALESLGAWVTGTVSSKTDLLIAGTSPSDSIMAQAKKHGTPVAGTDALQRLLDGASMDRVLADLANAAGGAEAGDPVEPASFANAPMSWCGPTVTRAFSGPSAPTQAGHVSR
jgi:hypothetical protein